MKRALFNGPSAAPPRRRRRFAPPDYDPTDAVALAKLVREAAALHRELSEAERLCVSILAGKIRNASVNNSTRGGRA